jgi:hypothetical protein
LHVQKGTNDVTLQPTRPEPPDDDNDLASLDELLDAGDPERQGARHRARGHEEWLRLAECLVGGWAPTLRTAILLTLVLAAGLTGVLATFGALGVAGVVLLCALLQGAAARLPDPR